MAMVVVVKITNMNVKEMDHIIQVIQWYTQAVVLEKVVCQTKKITKMMKRKKMEIQQVRRKWRNKVKRFQSDTNKLAK